MSRERTLLNRVIGRTALAIVTAAMALGLFAPTVTASPESDAADAITTAWEDAGGSTSRLGAKEGDVYPVGAGFAQDFADGKMFFTSATGAKALYGPVLDKYESLGGPAGSDLGFPTINEVPGLVGPDSRVSTFSAGDKPVIFWTPEHGAFVVRGAINAAWDKLGGSSGTLGVPVGDETYDGELATQKFSGGQISWNRSTKVFTTVPPELAAQLTGLQVPVDPTAAINTAWRAAGGGSGPLGAKQGVRHPLGDDGFVQDFAGGKVYFSPATGANAVEGDILAKYESLGGPVGSGLGFPVANETDGGLKPASRVSTFSADGHPVIFWTPEHGAFVVLGAMKAAWDKLGGATGDLGAPVGDQAVDGDTVTQKFTGGTVSWNRATNTFSTEPPALASSLSGLQLPGQQLPSKAAGLGSGAGGAGAESGWQWWWVSIGVGVLLLAAALALAVLWWRRHRGAAREVSVDADDAARVPQGEYAEDERWSSATGGSHLTFGSVPIPAHHREPSDYPLPGGFDLDQLELGAGWPAAVGEDRDTSAAGGDVAAEAGADAAYLAGEPAVTGPVGGLEVGGPEDPDAVDTAPTRIPPEAPATRGRHAAAETLAEQDTSAFGVSGRPAIHLPLHDPYEAPDGYPIKADTHSGLYYTPDNDLYGDVLAEIWLVSEEMAVANGFAPAH